MQGLGGAIPAGATWVRFPRFVGDAVMQFPVLRLLRQIGVGPIVVYGPRPTVGLVEDNELADCVVAEDRKPSPLELAGLLRRHRPERAICFPKSLRPPLAAWLAGVPERIGVSDGGARFFNTHHAPFWKTPGPFVLRYWAALAKRWPGLPAMPFAGYAPGVRAEGPKNGYVCLLPGSAGDFKCWPAGHFRRLAQECLRSGLGVVALGAASERALGDSILDGGGTNLCGLTDLRQAAAWLHGAAAAVGNDSGLSHLAAACGTRTIAIFGKTDPAASAPWGPGAVALKLRELPCLPCRGRECHLPAMECAAGVAPECVREVGGGPGAEAIAIFGQAAPARAPGAVALKLRETPCFPCYRRKCPLPERECLAGITPETVWGCVQAELQAAGR